MDEWDDLIIVREFGRGVYGVGRVDVECGVVIEDLIWGKKKGDGREGNCGKEMDWGCDFGKGDDD